MGEHRNYTLRALNGDKLKSEYHAVRRICFVNRNIFPDNMAHRLLFAFVVLEMEKKENMFEMNLINCCGFFCNSPERPERDIDSKDTCNEWMMEVAKVFWSVCDRRIDCAELDSLCGNQ
eukprot:189168_1